MSGIDGTPFGDPQHGLVWVTNRNGTGRGVITAGDPFQSAKRDITCSTGHIDQTHGGARIKPVDQRLFPQPVQPSAHQIIHQIISIGDGIEDGIDHAGMVFLSNAAEPEIGIPFVAMAFIGSSCHNNDISLADDFALACDRETDPIE